MHIADPLRLLLVEDHTADVHLVRAMLAQSLEEAYILDHVELIQDALDYLKVQIPDLIILDLNLPDSSNFEGLVLLSDAVPYVPIIVHSSLDHGPLLDQAIQYGAQDYLIKGTYDAGLFSRVLRYAVERQQTIRAARMAEERLRTILEHTSDGIVIVGADNEVLYANAAAYRLLHTDNVSLLNQPFHIPRPESGQAEWVLTDAHSIEHTLEGRYTPITWDNSEAFVVALRDITLHKQREDALRFARDMAEGMAADKDAYMAQMTHDLRSPLIGILGFAEVLENESLEPHQREFASIIRGAGKRLLTTISSVLHLSKLENNTQQVTMGMLNISALVENVVATYRLIAQDKGLAIDIELPAQPVHIYTDEQHLNRVIDNLVNNAIKYTERGSILVTLQASHENAIVSVSDTGVGMHPSFLPRIFDEYSREESYEQGHGLGLAITKKLVVLLGGTIKVESTLGEGSTFSVMLPTGNDAPASDLADAAVNTPLRAGLKSGASV